MTNNSVELDFTLSPDKMGADVREHMINLQNVYGYVSSIADIASYKVESIKLKIEEIDAEVESELMHKYPMKQKSKFSKKEINETEIVIEGEVFTLKDLKRNLNLAKKNYNEAKSKLKELELAINTAKSALAWDREEFKNV